MVEGPGRPDVLTFSHMGREQAESSHTLPGSESRPSRHTLLLTGFLTHQGLHSLGIRDPWPEPGGGCRREKGHLLLWVLTLVALISALVF